MHTTCLWRFLYLFLRPSFWLLHCINITFHFFGSSENLFFLVKVRFETKIKKKMKSKVVVEDTFVHTEETSLTVRKTSLFFTGDGFTAYDCKGQLVFRVDTYGPDSRDLGELVLMDATGRCLLTVRRKRPSLHNRWEGYLGEREEGKKPIFSVRRSSIIGRSNVTVEVYSNPTEEYQIEGSFAQRNCTFFNADKVSVAEIRRKVDACAHVVLGKDVFSLSIKPGFDCAFAMGLVLVLDQIQVDDFSDNRVDADPIITDDPNFSS